MPMPTIEGMESLDRPPRGWFALIVLRETARKWDWVAILSDVEDADAPIARCGLFRIPGKHRNYDAAWGALEDMMATRH